MSYVYEQQVRKIELESLGYTATPESVRDHCILIARAADTEIELLLARLSWLERDARRNPSFVAEWHARAVALGYDGVSDMLHSVERGEPPIHIAEVLARAALAKDGA